MFQCSSASRKFLNMLTRGCGDADSQFQCSSASRKFLNFVSLLHYSGGGYGFSALQRAENSSILVGVGSSRRPKVSVLFSEPKIPQSYKGQPLPLAIFSSFSALQRAENSSIKQQSKKLFNIEGFSALQRAENSSIPTLAPASIHISDRDDHASSFLSLPGASP